jgi:hypothetical protein
VRWACCQPIASQVASERQDRAERQRRQDQQGGGDLADGIARRCQPATSQAGIACADQMLGGQDTVRAG